MVQSCNAPPRAGKYLWTSCRRGTADRPRLRYGRYWISASGMATRHIAEDDLELYALDRLAEPGAAPARPPLAVPPLFAALRRPILDSAIRNSE